MKLDDPADWRVARIAAVQHGRVSVSQLMDCGLTRRAIDRRVERGRLHRVHQGVYAVGHTAETLHATFIAAVLAGGEEAVLSHWAALALWQMVPWDRRPIDIALRTTSGRDRKGIRFHHMVALDTCDLTRTYGIAVTTAARALIDVAPQLSDTRLRRLVRKAQAEGVATVGQIADALTRASGLPTRRIAALVADGYTPTYSGDEDRVLDLLVAGGMRRPVINQPLLVGTNIYYPDMRWPAQRLILEIDSRWHDGRLAREDDAARQADLEAAGERVLRTTMSDATASPHQLVARLIAAGAPRT